MEAVAALVVVAQWVAAGFVAHTAVNHALRQTKDRRLQRYLVLFSAAAALYLLVNPLVTTAGEVGQQVALGVRLVTLVVIWVAGIETVTGVTRVAPPRGFRPLVYAMLVARVVVFLSGRLVDVYVPGEGPVFTAALPWVTVPQMLLAIWWIGTVIRGTEHGRLARRVLGVLVFGIALAVVTVTVQPLQELGFALVVLPALWWVSTAARTNEEQLAEAAHHAEQVAARLQAELAGAQDDLERAEAVSRALVDAASHELRTPLSVILGGVELLERSDLPKSARDSALELVTRNARRLNELVEYLLAAKSTAEPERQPRPSLTTIGGPVRAALALHDDMNVDVRCPDDLRAWVDPLDLTLIVTALVSNAERHGGPGVTIESYRDEQDVVVRVEDDGEGVDPDFVDRLFLPFEQPTTGLNRLQIGGLGLGLSVARDRARANGGDLSHRREVDVTCFELRVPASHEAWATRHPVAP